MLFKVLVTSSIGRVLTLAVNAVRSKGISVIIFVPFVNGLLINNFIKFVVIV